MECLSISGWTQNRNLSGYSLNQTKMARPDDVSPDFGRHALGLGTPGLLLWIMLDPRAASRVFARGVCVPRTGEQVDPQPSLGALRPAASQRGVLPVCAAPITQFISHLKPLATGRSFVDLSSEQDHQIALVCHNPRSCLTETQ